MRSPKPRAASAVPSRGHPAPALVLGLFASARGFTEATGSSAERGCAGPGLPTPAWAPASPSPATRSIRTPAEEFPTLAEVCVAGLRAVVAHAEGWLAMAMDYHTQVMRTPFLRIFRRAAEAPRYAVHSLKTIVDYRADDSC